MSNRTYIESDAPSVIGDQNAITAYAAKWGQVPAISLVEWHSLPSDYRGITGGINPDLPAGLPTVMDYQNGTCLVIVRVVRDDAAVENRIAELNLQIQNLEKDLDYCNDLHYLADIQQRIANCRSAILVTQKMGTKY